MATPQPKVFTAATNFTYGGRRYKTGDPITDRRTIALVNTYGKRFVVGKKAATAETSANPEQAAAATESTEED